MRLLVDTNRYRDLMAGVEEVADRVMAADQVLLTFVNLGELRGGFLRGSKSHQNEALLTRFLNKTRVSILYANEETTHHYARLFSQLLRQGTPIPTNDIWIAALAVQHDLVLYSRDAHFDHLPQLARVD